MAIQNYIVYPHISSCWLSTASGRGWSPYFREEGWSPERLSDWGRSGGKSSERLGFELGFLGAEPSSISCVTVVTFSG